MMGNMDFTIVTNADEVVMVSAQGYVMMVVLCTTKPNKKKRGGVMRGTKKHTEVKLASLIGDRKSSESVVVMAQVGAVGCDEVPLV